MLVSLLKPEPTGKIAFSYDTLHTVPQDSGCYALTTHDGTILYIGQTIDICQRMEQHLDDGSKRTQTPWGVIFWLHYRLCDAGDLNNLENGWVNEHVLKEGQMPFFNKARPPA